MRIEEEIAPLLRARGWRLATAESATGGLVAHRVTNVPGSSDYFQGGVVAYHNDAKVALLGVRMETLVAAGAVSEEVAREMARGARARLEADVGMSTTGIAGPGGATATKPVGLTYIALSAPGGEVCRRYVFPGDRLANKEQAAEEALLLLIEYLKGITDSGRVDP
ncbi:MAG: CinA family protein [Anaerolineae bacterium]|nr:CinA family protein [Anaerolineae bacterium]